MNSKLTKRDNFIRKLRFERGWKLSDIAARYEITTERVSKICKETKSRQEVLDVVRKKYKKQLNGDLTSKKLVALIREMSKHDRSQETVISRRLLVKYLHNRLGLSFVHIGELLNRDHTTIINLYNKSA